MAGRLGSVGDHAEEILRDPLPVRLGMDASESDIHVCVCCFLKRNWGSFEISRATNTTLDSKQQRFCESRLPEEHQVQEYLGSSSQNVAN